jgi:glycosyltransferase involved in cell wall biosynthesis
MISIILPVRNCERTIIAAVYSIINQVFQEWELIVLDDGCSDLTVSLVGQISDKRIKIFSDGLRRGFAQRLNQGIQLATGEYIARMDGDDICYDDRLVIQYKYMRDHPEIDLVGGSVMVFDSYGQAKGTRSPPSEHGEICRKPYSGFPIAHPTFLGKADWFRRWRYSELSGGACDYDLMLRSHLKSRFGNVDKIILGYREDGVTLKKSLRYRMELARSLLCGFSNGGRKIAVQGLVLVAAKSAFEAVAVSTGLQSVLLRHRARPAKVSEIARWNQVWERTLQFCKQTHRK